MTMETMPANVRRKPAPRPERVLVADDDQDIRELISRILAARQCQVIAANNGTEAYQKTLARDFDLIILDINMPKMGGTEAVKAIRERDPHAFILIISGETDKAVIREAVFNGADFFLPKPFTPQDLLQAFDRIDFDYIQKRKRNLAGEKQENDTYGHGFFPPVLILRPGPRARRELMRPSRRIP
jgi:CheY-like chemotaxis protein